MMKKILSNRSGFTLIEAIISLAVLSIGILAMFAMQSLGIRGNANASRVSIQATWGEDEAEKIVAENYEVDLNQPEIVLPGDSRFTVTRVSTSDAPIFNMKRVDITITHQKDMKVISMQRLKIKDSY